MSYKEGVRIGWFKTHYGWTIKCGYCGTTVNYDDSHQPETTECCNRVIPYNWQEKKLVPNEEG